MQHTEKKTLSGYRHHVKAALAALLLCLAVPAAAADKADAPAPMLSTPTSNGGQQAMTKAAEETAVSINQATAETARSGFERCRSEEGGRHCALSRTERAIHPG